MTAYSQTWLSNSIGRTALLTGLVAFGACLSACGGGGGTEVASTPTPPPSPPPPPPPPPLGAPAVELLPAQRSTTPAPVLATSDVKLNLENVILPLTMTAVGPNFAGEAAIIDAGGSISSMDALVSVRLNHPNLGPTSYSSGSGFRLSDGRNFNTSVSHDLDYTVFGSWWVGRNTSAGLNLEENGTFIAGLETPVGNIPVSGTASYSGEVQGHYSEYYACQCASFAALVGNVEMTANFGNRTVSGLMTDLQVLPDASLSGFMNDVSFTANLANSQNWFSGSTATASSPNSPFALANSATGSIVGSFYGPSAQEVGAVWTLSDGERRVIGSFGAKSGN